MGNKSTATELADSLINRPDEWDFSVNHGLHVPTNISLNLGLGIDDISVVCPFGFRFTFVQRWVLKNAIRICKDKQLSQKLRG